MNLHFLIPIDEIERKANELYAKTLFEGDLEEMGARVKVKKQAPITIQAIAGKLVVLAPVHVYAKITWKERLLGFWDLYTPTFEETDFEITARYVISLDADSTWDLQAQVQGSFEWDRKPEVGLGPLKMKVTSFMKPLISTEINKVSEKIVQFVKTEVALRKRVLQAWEQIQLPQKVSNHPPVWMAVKPGQADYYTTQLQIADRTISCSVSLPMHILAGLGKARPLPAPKALLPFAHKTLTEKAFEIKVISSLPYLSFAQIYVGEELILKGIHFLIRGLGIKCKDGKLNVSLSLGVKSKIGPVTRNFRVVMFASAVPYMDEESKKIRVKEVDYAFLTADFFLRVTGRFFRKWFIRQLTDLIHQYLTEIDQIVFTQVQAAVSQTEITEYVNMEGKSLDFTHQELLLLTSRIEVTTRLRGQLDLHIGNF